MKRRLVKNTEETQTIALFLKREEDFRVVADLRNISVSIKEQPLQVSAEPQGYTFKYIFVVKKEQMDLFNEIYAHYRDLLKFVNDITAEKLKKYFDVPKNTHYYKLLTNKSYNIACSYLEMEGYNIKKTNALSSNVICLYENMSYPIAVYDEHTGTLWLLKGYIQPSEMQKYK